jgi:hypothetical protein
MDAMLWLLLPLFTAVGSALLAFYIMQARMEVAVAKEREAFVAVEATLKGTQREVEDKVRAAEEESKRRALDDFLADIRVEERQYLRQSKSEFHTQKSLVLQERLYFRNIPLSNWVEHEMVVDQGGDMAGAVRAGSVFASPKLQGGEAAGIRKLTALTSPERSTSAPPATVRMIS